VAVSFIGEGIRSTRKKPTTFHNIVSSTPRHEREMNSHPTTIRSDSDISLYKI